MLNVFVPASQGLLRRQHVLNEPLPRDALWLDLVEPTAAEEGLVEQALGVDVPTRDEMREIETSNRLYEESDRLYMIATIVTRLDTDLPEISQITFILTAERLVTSRYVDPLPFRQFITYAERHPSVATSPAMVLAGIVESIINRIADEAERVGSDLDLITGRVFAPQRRGRDAPLDYRGVLQRIGRNGELTSKVRESLVSLGRLLAFLQQTPDGRLSQEARTRFSTLSRDVGALSDHVTFLGEKGQFVLDATLGMVTIDQNNILKIFSVVTVVMLPPTLIASFYGMNFVHIPWLHERWGALVALGMMALSAILPLLFFKRRSWL